MMLRRSLSLALAAALAPAALCAQPILLRVEGSVQPNGPSETPAVSANGRVVAFASSALNLVPGTNNGTLFALDLLRQRITALVPGANANMYSPAISADGRYVAFDSGATNLAATPTSGQGDVYRIDRTTSTVVQVSRGMNATAPNGGSRTAAISGNGRYVAFTSLARNMVTPATQAGREHVYLADANTGAVELVTRSPAGAEADATSFELENAAVSRDGRRIIFSSAATNLAPVIGGNVQDVFVRSKNPAGGTATFQNLNRTLAGELRGGSSYNGAISPNGRYATFYSFAQELQPGVKRPALYLRDLDNNTLRALPEPAGFRSCNNSRVDDRGGVVMRCVIDNQTGIAQVFALAPGATVPRLVTRGLGGGIANKDTDDHLSIDALGEVVAIDSDATNLIPDDTNNASDIFLGAEPGFFDRLFRDSYE